MIKGWRAMSAGRVCPSSCIAAFRVGHWAKDPEAAVEWLRGEFGQAEMRRAELLFSRKSCC
jgi:hypothetical protein